MKTCPNIGDRVTYAGNGSVGPCAGVVERIYVKYTHPEDFDWGSDENPPITGLAPQEQWHVAMRPDKKPTPWCYGDHPLFAPEVKNLEPE